MLILPNRLPPTSSSPPFLRPSAILPRPLAPTSTLTWQSLARFSSRPPALPLAPTSHTTWWITLFLSARASWMLGVEFFCPTRALLPVSCSLFFQTRFHHANWSAVTQLQPFIESIFQLLHIISQESNRSEGLMRSAMGVIGYVLSFSPVSISVLIFQQ